MASLTPRDILLTVQTVTASGSSNNIRIPSGFTAAIIRLDSAAGSGTSPTLDIQLQWGIKDIGTQITDGHPVDGVHVFNDFIAFAQVTDSAASEQWAAVVGGGNQIAAAQDGVLTAASILSGPIGGTWRVNWVVAGTNPSFVFDIVCSLIP